MQTQLLKRNLPESLYQSINFKASKGDLAAEVSGSFLKIPLTLATPFPIQEAIPARSASALSVFTTLSKVRPVLPTSSPIYGPFSLPDGNNLTFRQLATGQWQATVQNAWLQRSAEMPVVCKGNVATMLSVLQGARATNVRSRIHIMEPVQDAECVYVGVLGVRGGGKKKKKNTKQRNGKKAKQKQNKTNTAPSKTMLASASLDATSISPQLLSMVARAQNPKNEVFKALEELRGLYTDSLNMSTTKEKHHAIVEDINNESLDKIWNLCNEGGVQENINKLLWTLLNASNSYLERRTKSIEDWLYVREGKRAYPPIPTCDYLFRLLYKGKESGEVKRYKGIQERIRQRFQVINSVIVHLFHAKLAQEGEDVVFEEETKQMIEKAKHVHALLAGGDFVGDVDDFIPSLSGVSSLLRATYPNPDADIDLGLIIGVRKAQDWMQTYGSNHAKNNRGNYDYDSKHPSLTLLQWYEKNRPVAARKDALRQIKEQMSAHDIVRSIAHFSKEQVLQDAGNQHFEANCGVETQDKFSLITFLDVFNQCQEPQKFIDTPSFFAHQASIAVDEQKSIPAYKDEVGLENLASDMTPDSGAVHQQLAHTDKQGESPVNTQLPIVSAPARAWCLPKELTGSSKATWKKLFDANYKINRKLTYDGYTLLWNTLGGKIKANKVGSHRGLCDQHGCFLGTIVELHGPKDSCYGP